MEPPSSDPFEPRQAGNTETSNERGNNKATRQQSNKSNKSNKSNNRNLSCPNREATTKRGSVSRWSFPSALKPVPSSFWACRPHPSDRTRLCAVQHRLRSPLL